LAESFGFERCSLGPYVLRSETAAIATLSVVIISLHAASTASG
jgi:16S rRNA U1498 N3-methylase RsmE